MFRIPDAILQYQIDINVIVCFQAEPNSERTRILFIACSIFLFCARLLLVSFMSCGVRRQTVDMRANVRIGRVGAFVWIYLLFCVSNVCLTAVETHVDHEWSNDGNNQPFSSMKTTAVPCCNQIATNETHRVEVEFITSIVQNEYIVRFIAYYLSATRERYLKAALNESQVRSRPWL